MTKCITLLQSVDASYSIKGWQNECRVYVAVVPKWTVIITTLMSSRQVRPGSCTEILEILKSCPEIS